MITQSQSQLLIDNTVQKAKKNQFKMFKLIVALSLIAVAHATVSGDYGSVGVQTDQTIRVSDQL
jgi:hypothetical protein